jgi:2-oxoisovalerate dehydrogenase E1 component alpha subunit
MSYRVGDHSTSDFSQRYRDENEMKKWKELLTKFGNPIERLEKYLLKKGLIKEGDSKKIREEYRTICRESLKAAIECRKPPIDDLFTDVYDQLP